MELVRKYLTADEIGTPALRWNSDCDCVQQSPDGGTTWVDTPSADPRSAAGFAMPPASSADPRCDGAARMVAALKRLIDIVVSSAGSVAAVSAVLGYLADFLFGIGTLVALVLEAVTGILALGQEVLDAAFTTDVYDEIECLAYARLGIDGHFDDAGWVDFQSAVLGAFSGTVNIAMGLIFQLEGINGFNNAASVGTETGDCSACPCDHDCTLYDFTTQGEPVGWHVFAGGYDAGYVKQSCVGGFGSDSTWNFSILLGNGSPFRVTHVELDMSVFGSGTSWSFLGIPTPDLIPPGNQVTLLSGVGATGDVSGDSLDPDTYFYGFQLITTTAAGCGTSDVWLSKFQFCSPDLAAAGLC